MQRKLFSIVLSVALVFTLLLAACSSPSQGDTGATTPPPAPTPAPVSVVDMTGKTVTLDKPAETVVVLTASAGEIVYALDAGSTVVGRGEYCNWPEAILAIPAVQSGADTNIEQIIALKPDLVLLTTMDQSPEQVKQIEDAGIPVYTSDADDIAGTYESILQIGTLMGKDAKAQAIVDGMKAQFEELAAKKLEGTIYFEVSPLEYGLWAAGNNTFMNEIADIIGLENIFADVDGWVEISEEQVLARNPDYILTVGMYFGEGLEPADEIKARPGWQDVPAVKNNNILNITTDELSRPGPRLADGAKTLYDFVNGK
jgi:iron complex transport system substrate-binding protein